MSVKEQKRHEQALSDMRWMTNPQRELSKFQIIIERMKRVYFQDNYDWIIAYSAGKDSSLTLDLTFRMLQEIAPEKREKKIHVVSADTLVETPQMTEFLKKNLTLIKNSGKDLGIKVHYVMPKKKESYWWNVIGKGNPAPTPTSRFQWCTKKMKIQPMNRKLQEILDLQLIGLFGDNTNYQATLLLGVRNAESTKRKRSINKHSLDKYFARHSEFHNIRVFHPIKHVKDADLWNYIHYRQVLAWGLPSSELWAMYSDGQEECPVIRTEKDKPCGTSNSRNGCWTCLYSPREDPMLETLIKAGFEDVKYLLEWKQFLYDVKYDIRYREPLRRAKYKEHANYQKVKNLFTNDDFYYNHYQRAEKGEDGVYKPGSYTIELRKKLLEKLLYAQERSGYNLITEEEIQDIIECWREDGYEFNRSDIKPINHQHDGAVVLKPDWSVRGKDTLNPRPNPNPIFYVPVEFQLEGSDLVSFIQERQRLTGKSIFCYFDYVDHPNIKLVYNKLVFIVCEDRITTQEQAKKKVLDFLFFDAKKEAAGTNGKPYHKMQGMSFEAAVQHLLLDAIKPVVHSFKGKKIDELDDAETRRLIFMHILLGHFKEKKFEKARVYEQLSLF